MRFLCCLLCLSFLSSFLYRGQIFIDENSQTFDEAVHLTSGYAAWKTGEFWLNIEHPPLFKRIQALPILLLENVPFDPDPELRAQHEEWITGKDWLYHSPVSAVRLLQLARRAHLLCGVLLLLLMGWWSYRLAGKWAGVVAVGIASADPNLLAHTCNLSTDLGLSLTMLAVFYALWEFLRCPTQSRVIFLGGMLGLCLAAKFSSVFVVLIFGIALLTQIAFGGRAELPGTTAATDTFRGKLRELFPLLMRVGMIAMLTLSICYNLWHLPDWGAGLKQQLLRNSFDAPSYWFRGEISSTGWLLYFPVAFLLKTPLPTLLLLGLALCCFRIRDRETLVTLVLPPVLFLLAMMLCRVNIGVRIILPIYPFLYVLIALLLFGGNSTLLLRVAAIILLIWLQVASLREGGRELAFFNSFADTPEAKLHWLGDSNLDWGQDLYRLAEWTREHDIDMIYLSYAGTAPPGTAGLTYQHLPTWGNLESPPPDRVPADARVIVAVSVSNLQGTYLKNPMLYRWLLLRKPVTTLGGAIWVYDLTDDSEAKARLREVLE